MVYVVGPVCAEQPGVSWCGGLSVSGGAQGAAGRGSRAQGARYGSPGSHTHLPRDDAKGFRQCKTHSLVAQKCWFGYNALAVEVE